MRKNIVMRRSDRPHDSARAAPAGAPSSRRRSAAFAEDHGACEQSFCQVQVVRAAMTMARPLRQPAKAADERARRGLVEPGERFVEQQEARLMEQRPFEREPLPHAARKS